MVSRKWTIQLSFGLTLPIAAAAPPSAITVWALPNSDLEMTATFLPSEPGLDGGPQARPAGADHHDVVRMAFDVLSHLSGPQLMKRRSLNQSAATAMT